MRSKELSENLEGGGGNYLIIINPQKYGGFVLCI